MKAILEYNIEDAYEKLAFKRASSADDAYLALVTIANEVFRPHRKHGYSDKELDAATDTDDGFLVAEKLEDMFYEILKKYNVDLEDLP